MLRHVAILIGLLAASACWAAPSATEVYQQAHDRIVGLKDYSLSYEVSGQKGTFKFEYRCVRPADIRTHIISGPHQGATLVYHGSTDPNRLQAHQGLFTIWKGDDADFKNGGLSQSIWDMALSNTAVGPPTLAADTEVVFGHPCYVLTFPNKSQLWVDATSYDILKWVKIEGTDVVTRLFYDIHVNSNPKIAI